MKKLLVLSIVMLVLTCVGLAAMLCGLAHAAGTVVQTENVYRDGDFMITLTCTADAAAATFPATTVTFRGGNIDGYIYAVLTDPGATAPQALYDITLTDANGLDIMGGELLNRSATATEIAIPKMDIIYGSRRVNGSLTLNISNNNVNSAQVVIKIFGYRE